MDAQPKVSCNGPDPSLKPLVWYLWPSSKSVVAGSGLEGRHNWTGLQRRKGKALDIWSIGCLGEASLFMGYELTTLGPRRGPGDYPGQWPVRAERREKQGGGKIRAWIPQYTKHRAWPFLMACGFLGSFFCCPWRKLIYPLNTQCLVLKLSECLQKYYRPEKVYWFQKTRRKT